MTISDHSFRLHSKVSEVLMFQSDFVIVNDRGLQTLPKAITGATIEEN